MDEVPIEEPVEAPPEKRPTVATILVAEDDADIRDLFTMALEGAGVEVVAVENGEAALAELEGRTFDMLVTDMWMPRVSGLDLCKKIRAEPATQEMPVLMLSAYGRLRGREEAKMAGASDYLMKPLRPSQLVSKVDAMLGGRLVMRT
ncbi:response regulator [Dactylosporangium vinaceum]|uniref:Response regulator n=1 Tax=Dactylosporangium vinaceum TaxID=53362 RepID=A0ABV5MF77_9ACTN|nr:response regulator [Dactylosporangium vinaceum]UAB98668.1 response regulator [Dactylosporangium vinaceum]